MAGPTRVGITVLVLSAAMSPALSACAGPGPAPADPHREVTREELRLLDRAEGVLIGRCMRDRGFSYTPHPTAARSDPTPGDYPFGLDDRQYAEEHGYGITEQAAAAMRAQSDDPNRAYVAGLDSRRRAEYTRAMNGDPADQLRITLPTGPVLRVSRNGCIAVAQRTLYGDFDRWSRAKVIVDNLRAEIDPIVGEDPRYQAAMRQWSACMRSTGHEYPGPGPIRHEIREASTTPGADLTAVRTTEIRLAVAESTCAARTGLVRVARELEGPAEARVRREREAEIQTVRQARLDALAVARSIITAP